VRAADAATPVVVELQQVPIHRTYRLDEAAAALAESQAAHLRGKIGLAVG
jgi:hypothetical protein